MTQGELFCIKGVGGDNGSKERMAETMVKTVRDWIRVCRMEVAKRNIRVAAEFAPGMVESLEAALKNVTGDVRGTADLGDLTVVAPIAVRTGRGGKKYVQMETERGLVNYYPNAKFGAFVALATEKVAVL